MAAISTVLELIDSGSHVIAMDDLYGGSYRLFEKVRRRSAGLDFSFIDLNDAAALKAALRRLSRADIESLLLAAAVADRIAKGSLRGDAWVALEALVARIAGVRLAA